MTTYNSKILLYLLNSNNITNGGCNEYGVVWDTDGKTEIQTRSDVVAVIASYTDYPLLSDYESALQIFLDQTAQAKGYNDEQDCLNGINQTDDQNWLSDAQTMLAYDEYCHVTLMGVFGYTGNTRLPGERQMNPSAPPSIDEFLNSTLNSISW